MLSDAELQKRAMSLHFNKFNRYSHIPLNSQEEIQKLKDAGYRYFVHGCAPSGLAQIVAEGRIRPSFGAGDLEVRPKYGSVLPMVYCCPWVMDTPDPKKKHNGLT